MVSGGLGGPGLSIAFLGVSVGVDARAERAGGGRVSHLARVISAERVNHTMCRLSHVE